VGSPFRHPLKIFKPGNSWVFLTLTLGLFACRFWVSPPGLPGEPEGQKLAFAPSATAIPTHPVETQLPPPIASATPAPTHTPVPPTETPIPSPTTAPVLRQLTTGGCCVQPFWSHDSQQVLYIDRPDPSNPAGIWGVALADGTAQLFTDRIGYYSADMQTLAFPREGVIIVEHLSDGQHWTISTTGRMIDFSPDGSQIAWADEVPGSKSGDLDREIWMSKVDGSEARLVIKLVAGEVIDWFPDGRLLVTGRLNVADPYRVFLAVSSADGSWQEIARSERFWGASLSPAGTWLAYLSVFHEDPGENGLWIVHTGTGEGRKLELFGSYRWRDDGHMLVIPLELQSEGHQIWQVEVASGEIQALTDPQVTRFKVANGDWSVSPDGQYVAYIAVEDFNIWLLALP
jgi:hypothetical protein